MTRQFNIHQTCRHCGRETGDPTGFVRWMRSHPALDSVHGIVRTDTDHWVLRYKTSLDGRDFQILMLVEVKEMGAKPRDDQWDIFHFVNVGMERKGKNRYGAVTDQTFLAWSKCSRRMVRVRYAGYHLLQFEKHSPLDSAWIKWDCKPIDADTLIGILALERNPYNPSQMLLELMRDRHNKRRQLRLELEDDNPVVRIEY